MNLDELVNLVCKTLELDKQTLFTSKRTEKYSDARFIIAKIAKDQKTKEGLPVFRYIDISKLFGRKTHKSALDWEYNCNEFIKTDKKFREKYNLVISKLENY